MAAGLVIAKAEYYWQQSISHMDTCDDCGDTIYGMSFILVDRYFVINKPVIRTIDMRLCQSCYQESDDYKAP